MRSFKKVKKIIEINPNSADAKAFGQLIMSLETEQDFPLQTLYDLNAAEFDLALEVLKDWRLGRFYIGKAKVFDASKNSTVQTPNTQNTMK